MNKSASNFRILWIALLLISLGCQSKAQLTVTLDSTELKVDTIASGLDIPWEIVWGPDDHIWYTERHGRISRVNPETGTVQVLLDHRQVVFQSGESGMLGLMLHPDFSSSPYVYTAYTYRDGGSIFEKIVRFTYQDDSLINEEILIDDITGNTTHDGCRFLLLPDQTVLISTGDARQDQLSQIVSNLSGKILRMNLDGSIPSDNPNPDSYVWTWGLRNSQGLTLGANGIIYSSEHGPNTDDEINILLPGRNYGWPTVNGFCNTSAEMSFCNDSNVVEPIFAWTPTIAPSDLIHYTSWAIPEWRNKLLLTVLKNKRIIALELSSDGTKVTGTKDYLNGAFGRLRDICVDNNGAVYLATNGASWSNTAPYTHAIIKLSNPKFNKTEDVDLDHGYIFPNPNNGGFHLRFNDHQFKEMKIYSSKGTVVDHLGIHANFSYENFEIPSGVYIIRLIGDTEETSVRWIKTI